MINEYVDVGPGNSCLLRLLVSKIAYRSKLAPRDIEREIRRNFRITRRKIGAGLKQEIVIGACFR